MRVALLSDFIFVKIDAFRCGRSLLFFFLFWSRISLSIANYFVDVCEAPFRTYGYTAKTREIGYACKIKITTNGHF
jgi:hypothetical protein